MSPHYHWAVIEYLDHNDTKSLPTLVAMRYPIRDEQEILWGGGLTKWSFKKECLTVLKDYGLKNDHDWQDIDWQFRKDFPFRVEIEHKNLTSDGFLSPDGELYTCGSSGHDSLAEILCDQYGYSKLGEYDFYHTLRSEKGWIVIQASMGNIISDFPPTRKQRTRLLQIAKAQNGAALKEGGWTYAELVDRYFRRWLVDVGVHWGAFDKDGKLIGTGRTWSSTFSPKCWKWFSDKYDQWVEDGAYYARLSKNEKTLYNATYDMLEKSGKLRQWK